MLLVRHSRLWRITASACAGTATFVTVGSSFFIAKGLLGVALLAAAPLAAAQAVSQSSQARLADEPARGPFVYEQLGATPSVRFAWSATAAAAAARVAAMGARAQARPAVADRSSVVVGSQTVAGQTPAVERRPRD